MAIEEQFYLLLPILVRLLPRRGLHTVLWAWVILAPIWRWAAFDLVQRDTLLLLPCRLDALMGGTLIACLERTEGKAKLAWLPLAAAAPLIDWGLHLLDPGYALAELSSISLGFCVIVFSAAKMQKPLPVVLRPVCWLGTGAYAIYLFHLLTFPLCRDNRMLMVPATCLIAWAAWRFIERPLIGFARVRWKYDLSQPREAAGFAASVALPLR